MFANPTDSGPDVLEPPDLILLLLRAPTKVRSARDRIEGITRLEKLLYLAERETEIPAHVESRFTFKAYHYGPYSKEVYEAVDLLEEAQLLKEERVFAGGVLDAAEEAELAVEDVDGVERRFLLTEDGSAVADLLANQYSSVVNELSKIKDTYAGMSLRTLIRYVYKKYPEDAELSRIRDQL